MRCDRSDHDMGRGGTLLWLRGTDARNSKTLQKYQVAVQMLQPSITVSVPFLGQMNT